MELNSHEPWRKAHWHCSPHNFDPSLQVPPHPVALHDITVRDGEECADVAFTVDDKVRIAEALALVGIRRMELFLTVPGWLEAVRAILRRKLPLDLYVTWHPGRVERVLDLGVRHIMVWYRIADEHQRYDLRRSRKELLDQAAEQIEAARKAGCMANLFIVEGSRAPLDQLKEAVLIGKQAGASAVTVVARPNRALLRASTRASVRLSCSGDSSLKCLRKNSSMEIPPQPASDASAAPAAAVRRKARRSGSTPPSRRSGARSTGVSGTTGSGWRGLTGASPPAAGAVARA